MYVISNALIYILCP